MSGPGDVAPEVLDRLRPICLGLPETYEEPAWVGIRWRVRKRTFAHVRTVEPDRQAAVYEEPVRSAYARAATSNEPFCVITFRSPLEEIAGLVGGGYPFFRADWGTDVVGMVLAGEVDWDELGELLTESFCVLAPKKLVALVERG